ncbi:IS200/IS605 family transposase [Butyrivibrio sp.]|uniref:IS200/IS605 family transposase n=1 Tax=Butyrivibrio sp. TaxID=28121 RepID=UPI0025C44501|nr:IS200/IS605 family transposase [Butyrivibrio sp.]MBQ9302319.1 IS200/IS605 family transposase [Butyrivibrio sp.]
MKTFKNNSKYHISEHIVYNCKYHVIFCPKYRRRVLVDGIDERLKDIFRETAFRHGFDIPDLEVMPDYVHLLIDCNPKYGIMQCIKDLKRESASLLGKEFPHLKSRLPNIWTRSVFVASVGTVSLETVKKYIKNQKSV